MKEDDDFLKEWEEIRVKGKINYILRSNSIIFFKSYIVFILITCILTLIISIVINKEILTSQIEKRYIRFNQEKE